MLATLSQRRGGGGQMSSSPCQSVKSQVNPSIPSAKPTFPSRTSRSHTAAKDRPRKRRLPVSIFIYVFLIARHHRHTRPFFCRECRSVNKARIPWTDLLENQIGHWRKGRSRPPLRVRSKVRGTKNHNTQSKQTLRPK